MKTSILNIRISIDIKVELEKIATTKNKAVSDIAREAINNYLKAEIEPSNSTLSKNLDILQSLTFSELIDWVYRKRIDPEVNEITIFIESMVDIIDEMENHPLFYPEILAEFKKISHELITMGTDPNHNGKYYNFPNTHNGGFCYDKLADFMCCIRYADDAITKVLFIK